MENRSTAIILTVLATLLCGFPGLCVCLYGALTALGLGTYDLDIGSFTSSGGTPALVGVVALCLGLLLTLIPVIVGIVTLRRKKIVTNINEPIPPAI